MVKIAVVVGTRPEAVEAGFVKIVGVNKQSIINSIYELLDDSQNLPDTSPFDEGNAGEKIVDYITELFK